MIKVLAPTCISSPSCGLEDAFLSHLVIEFCFLLQGDSEIQGVAGRSENLLTNLKCRN